MKQRDPKRIVHEVATAAGFSCCADGGCVFGHPGGVQTNGGCESSKLGRGDHHAARQRIHELAHAEARRSHLALVVGGDIDDDDIPF